MRGSRWVPPSISGTPKRRSVKPNRALGAATRRSHHSASSKPPARHQPETAAIVGFGEARRVKPSGPPGGVCASSVSSALRSAPAQNASSPAPVTISTRAPSSATKAPERRRAAPRAVGAVDGVAPLRPVDGEDGGGAGALVPDRRAYQPPRASARAVRALAAFLRRSLRLSSTHMIMLKTKTMNGNAAMMMKPALVTTLSFVSP